MRLVPGLVADASYPALALYGMSGRSNSIRALALSWLFTMGSPGLFPDASLESLGRYLVFSAVAMSALFRSETFRGRKPASRLTHGTTLVGGFLLTHSVLFSAVVDVSLLKATVWTLVAASLSSLWLGMPPSERNQLANQLYWFLALILIVSLPLIVMPLGYLVNGTGFQGVLNQPQAFGPVMALLAAWTIARIFTSPRPSWWLVAIAGISILMVLMSLARTAGLAIVLGIGLSLPLVTRLSGVPLRVIAPGLRSPRMWLLVGAAALSGLALSPVIVGVVQNFVLKSRTGIDSILDLYMDTRGMLIEPMIDNIVAHPWTGIGFGIASNPDAMIVDRDGVFGLPTGAAIEKGLAYLATVEELGIVGAVIVAFWLLGVIRRAGRNGFVSLALCFTALATNLAESTLFSPGGTGLIYLTILIGAATGPMMVPERA